MHQTHGDYTTCTEMYGNGVGTGMEAMQLERRLIPLESLTAPTACYAAAVGTALGGAFVQRIGTSAIPAAGATLSASVSSAPEFQWGSFQRNARTEATGRSVGRA